MCACMLTCFSCVQLFVTPETAAHQDPLTMGFSRKEYWSGFPYPPTGDLPDSGINPGLLWFLHAGDFLLLSHQGSPLSELCEKWRPVQTLTYRLSSKFLSRLWGSRNPALPCLAWWHPRLICCFPTLYLHEPVSLFNASDSSLDSSLCSECSAFSHGKLLPQEASQQTFI